MLKISELFSDSPGLSANMDFGPGTDVSGFVVCYCLVVE